MQRTVRVDATSYYNTLPGFAHECGDIWRDLPSFGLLGGSRCSGIVITPACDLSWHKSDTLTYLPIIPIRAFFATDAALPLVIDRVVTNMKASNYSPLPKWASGSYVAPDDDEISSIELGLGDYRASKQHPARILVTLDRAIAGIKIIKQIKSASLESILASDLQDALGSEWSKIKSKIVNNSYSSALHFLPNDQQESMFSGVSSHSVALFRCPITVPMKIVNMAQEVGESDWCNVVTSMEISDTMKEAFNGAQPIKLLSLRSVFLSDLLTRFSALYNRVGSPDFSSETTETYSLEVDA